MDVGQEDAGVVSKTHRRKQAIYRLRSRVQLLFKRIFGRTLYRPLMKAIHKLNWCWMQVYHPDGDELYWCHWCGMRARK